LGPVVKREIDAGRSAGVNRVADRKVVTKREDARVLEQSVAAIYDPLLEVAAGGKTPHSGGVESRPVEARPHMVDEALAERGPVTKIVCVIRVGCHGVLVIRASWTRQFAASCVCADGDFAPRHSSEW